MPLLTIQLEVCLGVCGGEGGAGVVVWRWVGGGVDMVCALGVCCQGVWSLIVRGWALFMNFMSALL